MTDAYNERFGLSNWLRLLESGEPPATFSSDVQASGKNIVKKHGEPMQYMLQCSIYEAQVKSSKKPFPVMRKSMK